MKRTNIPAAWVWALALALAGGADATMAPMRMRVRRAGAGDEGRLRALRLQALSDSPTAFASTYDRESARSDEDWGRWLEAGATFFVEDGDGDGEASSAPLGLVAVLNDDAPVHPGWLSALVGAANANSNCGMFSCQIRLAGTPLLDSTALQIAVDGSSIQRGHETPWSSDSGRPEALLPSGCAALYRREALDASGWFDESFFLYCEDTDLGLRARLAGWKAG